MLAIDAVVANVGTYLPGPYFGDLTITVQSTAPFYVTPLPATLPLFATGLGGLGLLGWRRERKAQAMD